MSLRIAEIGNIFHFQLKFILTNKVHILTIIEPSITNSMKDLFKCKCQCVRTYVIHGWFHDKTLYLSRAFSCVLSELYCTQDRQRVTSRFYCRATKLPAPVVIIAVTKWHQQSGRICYYSYCYYNSVPIWFYIQYKVRALKKGKKEVFVKTFFKVKH